MEGLAAGLGFCSGPLEGSARGQAVAALDIMRVGSELLEIRSYSPLPGVEATGIPRRCGYRGLARRSRREQERERAGVWGEDMRVFIIEEDEAGEVQKGER